jgi:hypothetical protein
MRISDKPFYVTNSCHAGAFFLCPCTLNSLLILTLRVALSVPLDWTANLSVS